MDFNMLHASNGKSLSRIEVKKQHAALRLQKNICEAMQDHKHKDSYTL